MKANETLAKIPVVSAPRSSEGLKWARAAFQAATVLALVLVPLTGLFRIDVASGFVVLGRQIWFSDFHIVFGFWLAVACSFILMYSTVGTAFCGWACPQNTFSSIANSLTSKHLGKRAVIDWEPKSAAKIAKDKNTWSNWALLAAKLLGLSLFLALIPVLYFVPPEAIWSFLTLQDDPLLPASLYWIYSVFVFIVFVNLAVIRHFVCRYMCIYRMWQFLFKTGDTLHVEYDESRSDDCAKCNYCVTSCMVEIDPRRTQTFDSCTNCGACITACDRLHSKKGQPGLLRFRIGPRKNHVVNLSRSVARLMTRVSWVLPAFVLGLGLFGWGLWSYDPYRLAVYKSEAAQGSQMHEYQIKIAHKLFRPGDVNIVVEGIPAAAYALSGDRMHFDSVGWQGQLLSFNSGFLEPGLHTFLVRVESSDGWADSYRIQHLVTRG